MVVRFQVLSVEARLMDEDEPAYWHAFMKGPASEYVALARTQPIGGEEDWGIYLEVNDQAFAAYDAIRRCELSKHGLRILLEKPLSQRGQIEGVEVTFDSEVGSTEQLIQVLRLIFAGHEEKLIDGQPEA